MAASNDQPDISHGTDSAINPSDANQANDPVLKVLLDIVAHVLSEGDPSEKASALEALGPNPTWEEIYEQEDFSDPYGKAILFNEFGSDAYDEFGLDIGDYLSLEVPLIEGPIRWPDFGLTFPQSTQTLGQLADAIRSDLKEQDTTE